MCGIVGGVALRGSADHWAAHLPQALQALAKRGPDAEGRFDEGAVCLGHRRLSILDLSVAGNQPMQDPSGRYVLVFNGEVFNFRDLQRDLPDVAWRSTSDTEVVLHLLLREGPACLDRLNGFFALAFYDRQTRTLLLARDRYGIKPLLLYQDGDKLLFASELKALLALGIPRALDMAAVQLYFELNYLPPHEAVFQGVRKLGPGAYLTVRDGQVAESTYYQVPPGPSNGAAPTPADYQAAQRQLVHLLDAAVARRLISDVPVGLYLSGGIDSSVVAALAVRHTQHLRTFSISFDNPLYDEAQYAEAVARKFHTDHTVFRITHDELYGHLSDVLDYIDEPFADPSAVNFFVISQYARPDITVALTGDAADELFGGYHRQLAEWRARQPGLLNTAVRALAGPIGMLPANRNSHVGRRIFQAQKLAAGLTLPAAERYWRWAQVDGSVAAADLLLHPAPQADLARRRARYTGHLTANSSLNQVLQSDMQLVLAGDMLVKGDLMSMANSLEVRTPFLDYDLVDYVTALPASYKIHGGMRKRILQDAFRNVLPEELYNRPKQGFEVPLRDWFVGPMRAYVEREVVDADFLRAQGIFRPEAVARLWDVVRQGRNTKEDWTLWALVVFQHFYGKYLITI